MIDELAIEKMIYFIEEIIESKPLRNLNISGVAVTSDAAMTHLSQLFLVLKSKSAVLSLSMDLMILLSV